MVLSRPFLTDAWIEREIQQVRAPDSFRGTLERNLTEGLLTSIGATEWEAHWGSILRTRMRLCVLEYVRGAPPGEVRTLCRQIAETFVPELSRLDFSPRTFRGERMLPSAAKRAVEQHGGKWWKADQYYAGAEWSEMNQPLGLDIERLWLMVAVAGDRDLAHTLAAGYRVPEASVLRADDKYLVRRYILRHALADDRISEAALVGMLLPGYAAGQPQELIEFPIAVSRGDDALLQRAVKKTSTTFRGKWDVKKMRAWFEKRAHRQSIGTWEQVIERQKLALLNYHWVLSWWALAWLNIARWRGMTSIFQQPKSFSEWVPMALCDA